HELGDGRNCALRLNDGSDPVEALIRHGHYADVGLNGAEGVVGRFGRGGGQGRKDGRLTNVWQSDDSTVHTHNLPLILKDSFYCKFQLYLDPLSRPSARGHLIFQTEPATAPVLPY